MWQKMLRSRRPPIFSYDTIAGQQIPAAVVPAGLGNYGYYCGILEPTENQLEWANNFFLHYPPRHLWSVAKFKQIQFGEIPEVYHSRVTIKVEVEALTRDGLVGGIFGS